MSYKFFLCLFLAAPLAAQTATMVKVANEGDTITTTTAVVYTFGSLTGTTTNTPTKVCSAVTFNCFAPPVTTTGPKTISVVNGVVDTTDPAFGVGKSLYLIPQGYAQSGTTKTAAGVTTAWTVPATTTTITLPSTSVCTQNATTKTIICTVTVTGATP